MTLQWPPLKGFKDSLRTQFKLVSSVVRPKHCLLFQRVTPCWKALFDWALLVSYGLVSGLLHLWPHLASKAALCDCANFVTQHVYPGQMSGSALNHWTTGFFSRLPHYYFRQWRAIFNSVNYICLLCLTLKWLINCADTGGARESLLKLSMRIDYLHWSRSLRW